MINSRTKVIDRALAPLLISGRRMKLSNLDLHKVCGGIDWAQIKQQAQPYCPQTVAKYGNTDPSKLDNKLAHEMGNACLAEMGPGKAFFARGRINKAIDQAFPKK